MSITDVHRNPAKVKYKGFICIEVKTTMVNETEGYFQGRLLRERALSDPAMDEPCRLLRTVDALEPALLVDNLLLRRPKMCVGG